MANQILGEGLQGIGDKCTQGSINMNCNANCTVYYRLYLHHPEHLHYRPVPCFFRPGQEVSEGSWPPGAEKWLFYNRSSIRIGHFWATARAAETRAMTTF